MKRLYPVIFTQTKDVVLVEVPDLEILTEGKNMIDAFDMVRDAMGIKIISMEDRKIMIPEASKIEDINVDAGTFAEDGKGCISLVDIDCEVYRRRIDTKMVRRNVTLPNWLNQEADAAQINVSKVFQEALMARLGVSK